MGRQPTDRRADNLRASVIEDPGLVISDDGVLTKYTGEGGNVTIPHRVTSIGAYAFDECTSLASVTIPP